MTDEVRDMIVESAATFFNRFGFKHTTMENIAESIHKAKGLIYYYFKSKEELFKEVLWNDIRRIKAHLMAIANSEDDTHITLKKFVHARLELLEGATSYHEVIKAQIYHKSHVFLDDIKNDFEDFEKSQLSSIIRRGEQRGDFKVESIPSTVNGILTVLGSLDFSLFLIKKRVELDTINDEISTLIVNSVRREIA
ncbi:MAG TPA: TetR/AcrR family transcriptional regulator [Tenuifilaceae bacterium]|jgi:AcrR family transcriptional regulator|nr:TetR/AcrR family transcriptional regulator [Bacteroidales bacterium]HNY08534.1 TetR/AcrR family transcriptional regulator [Tenuifilaceae bacterium]HOA10280.1 TetR/AcrR family transcriptional regulator [Tenuifilaceae bacterium]HOC37222.1 TetR/AcrR family transcriptional regulator [Tenuifilaceae bacterium]HPA68198.1 TetR/AcrR family transcriptional regulator [Tenuifilaceae bacterium]